MTSLLFLYRRDGNFLIFGLCMIMLHVVVQKLTEKYSIVMIMVVTYTCIFPYNLIWKTLFHFFVDDKQVVVCNLKKENNILSYILNFFAGLLLVFCNKLHSSVEMNRRHEIKENSSYAWAFVLSLFLSSCGCMNLLLLSSFWLDDNEFSYYVFYD